ncbi:MAG: hypothetical protein PHQ75_06360, partial [Thermoguttaceae bacterium]|nr:hypothetical protein [Thermoguttaceae bacterium]
NRIIAWASPPSHGNNMYMFDVNTQKAEVCKDIFSGDPHLTLVPGTNGRWVLCDTRAKGDNDNWLQTVYLCNMETGKRVAIGRFTSPLDFTYAWRIDLHPNCSRDGKKVLLDTAVDGDRQMYIIDIDGICD